MGEVKESVAEIASAEAAKPAQAEPDSASTDTSIVTIPVENVLPDNIPTYYSDGMVVLHSANEFIISFLQTHYPLAGSKEELEQVKSMTRRGVVRIIMSPAQFEASAKALQDNFKKYQDSYRKPQSE